MTVPGIGDKKVAKGSRPMMTEAFSWAVEDEDSASKLLDKSAFIHGGTGVPQEIAWFFLRDGNLSADERRIVTLVHAGCPHHAKLSTQATIRTRLLLGVSFSALLQATFPRHQAAYDTAQEPDSTAILRLRRGLTLDTYEVSFASDLSEAAASKDEKAASVEDGLAHEEGASHPVYGRRYERSAANRREAIRIHGLSCNICGFNFARTYGIRGADYIEVHHLEPLSVQTQVQLVDPHTDLVTICANCHRMIHRDPNAVLSVADLRQIITNLKQCPA